MEMIKTKQTKTHHEMHWDRFVTLAATEDGASLSDEHRFRTLVKNLQQRERIGCTGTQRCHASKQLPQQQGQQRSA